MLESWLALVPMAFLTTEDDLPELVLASASPRRRELLALTGLNFRVAPAPVDETPQAGEQPQDFARRMSRAKAAAAANGGAPGLVLAADTDVASEGRILGKPATAPEARAMLRELRGQAHQVVSAITLLDTATGESLTDLARTDVPMRAYSDDEIEAYIATGDPFDKAGAYAIQHEGFHPVEDLHGCYANVMGLPLCHLTRSLKRLGRTPPRNVPQACQEHTGYACPVYQEVLEGRL